MLDWDDNHNVRIFGLAPLSPANFENFVRQASSSALNISLEQKYITLKHLLDTAEDNEFIIAIRNSDNKVISIKEVELQDKPYLKDYMKDWLDIPIPARDWFAYLELSR